MIKKQIIAEGLMSQLADEIIPTYDSTGKTLYTVITELLAFQKHTNPIHVDSPADIEPTWEDLSGWVSPTSTDDPDSGWLDDAKAIDNIETTYAKTPSVPKTTWSELLYSYHAGVVGDKVKLIFSWSSSETSGMSMDFDVQYDGNWFYVYTGSITGVLPRQGVSMEFNLSGTKTVTGLRVKFYNGGFFDTLSFSIHEFKIWGIEGGKLSVTNQSILWALLQLYDIVGEGFIYVDNDRHLHWPSDIGDNTGQQVRYRKNLQGITKETDWGGLSTRLYPVGNDVALSDLTVLKEALI